MGKMILGVKIKNNENGLYRLKDGTFSKNGKTYSTLGFAKSSITNSIWGYHINKTLLDCEFVIFYDDCSIENIPVKKHIIDYFEKELGRLQARRIDYVKTSFPTQNVDNDILKVQCQLDYLKKEGK